MASAVDNFFKLDFEESQYFINHYKVTTKLLNTHMDHDHILMVIYFNIMCVLFRDLLNIEIKSLITEMIVVNNSFETVNKQFDIKDLRISVEKHVYPNLYKLLQVLHTNKYYFIFFVPL